MIEIYKPACSLCLHPLKKAPLTLFTKAQTVRITTFNALNNPTQWEERLPLILEEAEEHGTEILILQEILTKSLDYTIKEAHKHQWHVTESGYFPDVKYADKEQVLLILSKENPQNSYNLYPDTLTGYEARILIAEFQEYFIINTHLAWGSHAELTRLETVYQITEEASRLTESHPQKLIFFGGDFNAIPETETMRYLHGLTHYKGTSTHWTNGWVATDTPFPTARKDGGFAEHTAKNAKIFYPELLPDRIIDNILVYGWLFGKKGCPVSVQKFGTKTLSNGFGMSDHYGLTVDFLLTP